MNDKKNAEGLWAIWPEMPHIYQSLEKCNFSSINSLRIRDETARIVELFMNSNIRAIQIIYHPNVEGSKVNKVAKFWESFQKFYSCYDIEFCQVLFFYEEMKLNQPYLHGDEMFEGLYSCVLVLSLVNVAVHIGY